MLLRIIPGFLVGLVCFFLYLIRSLPKLKYIPTIIVKIYGVINRDSKFGLNIKTTAYLLLPFLGIAVLPMFILSAGMFGLYRGTINTIKSINAFSSSTEDFIYLDQTVNRFITLLSNHQPDPLPPKTRQFDIGAVKGLVGLCAGLMMILVGSPTMTLIMILSLPRVVVSVVGKLQWRQDWFLNALFTLLLLISSIVFIPVFLFGAIMFNMVMGCYRGYDGGLTGPIHAMMEDCTRLYSLLLKLGSAGSI